MAGQKNILIGMHGSGAWGNAPPSGKICCLSTVWVWDGVREENPRHESS